MSDLAVTSCSQLPDVEGENSDLLEDLAQTMVCDQIETDISAVITGDNDDASIFEKVNEEIDLTAEKRELELLQDLEGQAGGDSEKYEDAIEQIDQELTELF